MDHKFKKLISELLNISDDFVDIKREECSAWDSMKHMEIIIKLQKVYSIKFELADILDIKKISDFSELIEKRKLNEK